MYFFPSKIYLKSLDKSNITWSPWSECTVTCGKGVRVRFPVDHNLHSNHGEDEFRSEICELIKCPGMALITNKALLVKNFCLF